MRLLLDTNVVLDVLLDRAPFAEPAVYLFSRVEEGALTGFLCATTVTTVHYLAAKAVGVSRAHKEIRKLLNLFEVAHVNRIVLEAALAGKFADFEDAVLHESARHANVEAIVTRNLKDFKTAELTIYAPEELATALKARNKN